MSERARIFETAAADYERYRPEYPAAALAWVADRLDLRPGARVLDLGAGTGKLTRGLHSLGLDVVAVEPGGPMLERLRAAVPEVEAHEGSAEAIPLPDASVDAATAGQAYHWFDHGRALPELRRVLRPRGGVALLWNWWDLRDPFQRRVGDLLDVPADPTFGRLPEPPGFEELGRARIESVLETTPEAFVGRIATTSALLNADPAPRGRLLHELRGLAAAHGERFELPQLTYVLAFRLL